MSAPCLSAAALYYGKLMRSSWPILASLEGWLPLKGRWLQQLVAVPLALLLGVLTLVCSLLLFTVVLFVLIAVTCPY